jgi:hypothetical protein
MATIATAISAAHACAAVIARILNRGKYLVSQFTAVLAEARIHRARLEAEIYRGRYRLRTKNDDDLPIVS